jgi:hypothetical protein
MYRILALLFAGMLTTQGVAHAKEQDCTLAGQKPGYYSRLGVVLCFQDSERGMRHLEVPSPDGTVTLRVDGSQGSFFEKGRQTGPAFTVAADEEVVWSSDSKALLTTVSLGGLGPAKTGVLYVHADSASLPDLTKLVQDDFAARHKGKPCNQNVNVGALTWEEKTTRAVLVAEVPSSSACGAMMGHFEAYELSLPDGKILARYTMEKTIQKWRTLLPPTLTSR